MLLPPSPLSPVCPIPWHAKFCRIHGPKGTCQHNRTLGVGECSRTIVCAVAFGRTVPRKMQAKPRWFQASREAVRTYLRTSSPSSDPLFDAMLPRILEDLGEGHRAGDDARAREVLGGTPSSWDDKPSIFRHGFAFRCFSHVGRGRGYRTRHGGLGGVGFLESSTFQQEAFGVRLR